MSILAYNEKLSNSLLGRLEVRVKIVSFITVIAIFSTIQNPAALLIGTLVLLSTTLLIGIPLASLIKRLLWLLPFAGFMIILFPFITPGKELFTLATSIISISATEEGLIKSLFLIFRVLNAAICVTLLVVTTPLRELLHGLQLLKVPSIMVSLISFTLRYLEVLIAEVKKMQIARKARGFQEGKSFFHRHTMKTLGLLVATLFLRAAARGDRIYYAMLSRGYRGEEVCCGHCSPQLKDWIAGGAIVALGLFLKIAEWRGI
jgi:cobalt/nickel transport system permease protein